MHLGYIQVKDRHKIQLQWMQYFGATWFESFCCLHEMKILLLEHDGTNPVIHTSVDFPSQIKAIEYNIHLICVEVLHQLDHLIYDDNPLQGTYTMIFHFRWNIRLDDWDDSACVYTNFFRGQPTISLWLFWIRSSGSCRCLSLHYYWLNQSEEVSCLYRIHPEELFLFFMKWCKKGNKCYNGWLWLHQYLDRRYQGILGHQGILYFCSQFPQFFQAIQKKL